MKSFRLNRGSDRQISAVQSYQIAFLLYTSTPKRRSGSILYVYPMGRRPVVPLYKTRMVAFVEGIDRVDNPDKALASHLQIGTGPRADTICHTHSSWFGYEDDSLYYYIPKHDVCRKYSTTDPCGDCNSRGHSEYEPKTPAAEGRRLLISNEWTNPVTKQREYFGLRDRVEQFFAIDDPQAPPQTQIGNKMIGGDGISVDTLNSWIRDVGSVSSISSPLREDWIREAVTLEESDRETEPIKQFGQDEHGNEIPDLISHDMRASYITQLMRNDVSRSKAINKTGHRVPESMNPYIKFAEKEIDSEEEDSFF